LEDHDGEAALGVSLNQHEQADLHVSSFRPVTRGGVMVAGYRFRRVLLTQQLRWSGLLRASGKSGGGP
jgi:hypothetical protein